MSSIQFFNDGIQFRLGNSIKIKAWVKTTVRSEHKNIHHISIIFCSDSVLSQINVDYLKHDTLTDIITFDYSENADALDGEIYISIDRVLENASKFRVRFEDELHRIIIHGVLHLIGYSDKDPAKRRIMRKKENQYLSLRTY